MKSFSAKPLFFLRIPAFFTSTLSLSSYFPALKDHNNCLLFRTRRSFLSYHPSIVPLAPWTWGKPMSWTVVVMELFPVPTGIFKSFSLNERSTCPDQAPGVLRRWDRQSVKVPWVSNIQTSLGLGRMYLKAIVSHVEIRGNAIYIFHRSNKMHFAITP